MFRLFFHLRWTKLALVALAAVGIWPAAAEAGVLSFRNETDFPVMLQGVSIINRVARRGKLHLLRPGEVVRELNLIPGTKLMIIIADAKQPTRILCQEIVPYMPAELFYAIQRDEAENAKHGTSGSPKSTSRKAVTPKVKLVPSKPAPPASVPSSKPHQLHPL
jgi:hypothetical protein